MTSLMLAHSGLRFLVLLLGVVNLAVLGMGLARAAPFTSRHRALGASFAGALHLQVLLGLAAVATLPWQPKYVGHLVMMVAAAGVAQAAMTVNRRRPTPGLTLPLVGVAVALLCILAGVAALGRGVMTTAWLAGQPG